MESTMPARRRGLGMASAVAITAAVAAAAAVCVASAAASTSLLPRSPPPLAGDEGRRVMFWLLASSTGADPDPPGVWARRVAEVKAHRANVTGVSPCMYSIDPRGGFGTQPKQFPTLVKELPQYAALGLEIEPLIDAAGGVGGIAALLRNPDPFISAAVSAAVKNNYSGYNFDNEARGGTTDASWRFLKDYGEPWVAFLSRFADALHAHDKTLSVDIAGCCGWVDRDHPLAPAGHCGGAFATHEFVDTTCEMYRASRVDTVYGMSTYSGRLNGPPFPDPKDNNTYDGPAITRAIANATQSGVGAAKYGIGIKGGWPYCANATDPTTCVFDDVAKETVRHVRDALGVTRASQWVNEPRSQGTWDAYGFFLHGDA